jgi:3-hexulose-6-phosphate synthase
MPKTLIQMALNSLNFDQTIELATQVAPYVDIFEIGTPCVKHNGIDIVREFKIRFPDKLLLVDLKTMEAGEYESTPFFAAGADIVTVLGVSDMETRRGVIKAANAYGAKAQIDLTNVEDKIACAQECAEAGAHIIGVQRDLAAYAAGGGTPFNELKVIASLGLPVEISVTGGTQSTVDDAVRAGADIIVVGAAISGAASPAEAALEIRDLVNESSNRPFFYYDVSGDKDKCNGKECLINSELKLLFSINKLSETAVKALADKLKGLEFIDISIIATGYSLTSVMRGAWQQRLWLSENDDPNKLTQIEFKYLSKDSVNQDSGFGVTLEYRGKNLYQFWIPIPIVDRLSVTQKEEGVAVEIDLDILDDIRNSTRSDVTLTINNEDPNIVISLHQFQDGYFEPILVETIDGFSVSKFQSVVSIAKKEVDLVANQSIWNDWELNGNIKGFKDELKKVAKAGWKLRQKLCDNPTFKQLIDTIEQLKPNSRITVNTNELGFPWEILYLSNPDKNGSTDPTKFWGVRYRIECLRFNNYKKHKKRFKSVQFDIPKLTCIIDNSIDSEHSPFVNNNFSGKNIAVNIVDQCENKKEAIKNNTAQCIYIFCHGVSNEQNITDELLKLERGDGCEFSPFDLQETKPYNSNPLVIINACGTAAISAFSSTSFSEEFSLKNAKGVVGPLFSVPTACAMKIGEALLSGYLVDKREIGEILFAIRREWAEQGNPTPLFYQLQCSMDARLL